MEQGFGAHYTIVTIRNPQNSIGNDLGPYITHIRDKLGLGFRVLFFDDQYHATMLSPKGPGAKIVNNAALTYLNRDYFKAKV